MWCIYTVESDEHTICYRSTPTFFGQRWRRRSYFSCIIFYTRHYVDINSLTLAVCYTYTYDILSLWQKKSTESKSASSFVHNCSNWCVALKNIIILHWWSEFKFCKTSLFLSPKMPALAVATTSFDRVIL